MAYHTKENNKKEKEKNHGSKFAGVMKFLSFMDMDKPFICVFVRWLQFLAFLLISAVQSVSC